MKEYGGVDVWIHIFLTSALAGGECSASRPERFNPGERAPGTHWTGGWTDPRAGLDDMGKWKSLLPPGLELRSLSCPSRSQSLYWLLSLINYYYWKHMVIFHCGEISGHVPSTDLLKHQISPVYKEQCSIKRDNSCVAYK
jgi:hypothetical protein